MYAQYKALLWEQTRVLGVLWGSLCLLALALALLIQSLVHARYISLSDADAMRRIVFFCVPYLGALLLTLRQNTHSHIVFDFERACCGCR